MGHYRDREGASNFDAKFPRPDLAPIRKDRTGDAAKDGFTGHDRRPRHGKPGDMIDKDRAAEYDRMYGNDPDGPMYYIDY